MTEDQIVRVRSTWSIALAAGDDLTREFYASLFRQSPTAEAMFARANLADQARKLAHTLDAVVINLDDMPALVADIEAMGRRHTGYGVNEHHYALLGDVLVDTIERFVGDGFSRADRDAWRAAYAAIADVMMRAAQETQELPRHEG